MDTPNSYDITSDVTIAINTKHPSSNCVSMVQTKYKFKCKHKPPTLLVLRLNENIKSYRACEQVSITEDVLRLFKMTHRDVWVSNDERCENLLHDSLSVLFKVGQPIRLKNSPSSTRATLFTAFVGCGYVPEPLLALLHTLQTNYHTSIPLPNHPSIFISGWMIADLSSIQPSQSSRKRVPRNYFYLGAPDVFYNVPSSSIKYWQEPQVTIEGSGQYEGAYGLPVDRGEGLRPIKPDEKDDKVTPDPRRWPISRKPIIRKKSSSSTTSTTTTKAPTTTTIITTTTTQLPIFVGNLPRVNVKLGKIFLDSGELSNFRIPQNTFYDSEDTSTGNMILEVYFHDLRVEYDTKIEKNNLTSSTWISFDNTSQIIEFIPLKRHIGQYHLVVCAIDFHFNRVCDRTDLIVQRPKQIKSPDEVNASGGVIFQYKLSGSWKQSIRRQVTDPIIISITSDSAVYEWNAAEDILFVLTEASSLRYHQIEIRAENLETGKVLIRELTVNVKGRNTYEYITSSEIILHYSIKTNQPLSLSIFARIRGAILKFITEYHKLGPSLSQDVLLYKIIDGAALFQKKELNNTGTFPSRLIISFVYSPVNAPYNCDQVQFTESLLISLYGKLSTLLHKQLELQKVTVDDISGKCRQQKKLLGLYGDKNKKERQPTTKNGRKDSGGRNVKIKGKITFEDINFEVQYGFIFRKTITYSYDPEYEYIRSMVLYTTDKLIVDSSSWLGLFTETEFAIFGVPLEQHTRNKAYEFKIQIKLKNRQSKWIRVFITVRPPEFQPIYRFKLNLKIYKHDVEYLHTLYKLNRASFSQQQLLISETAIYRWTFVQLLGNYLYGDGDCLVNCGKSVFVHYFMEPSIWQIQIEFSLKHIEDSLDVLSTRSTFRKPILNTKQCQNKQKKSLEIIQKLLANNFNKSIVMNLFPSHIYSFSADPSLKLINRFKSSSLGEVTKVSVKLGRPCKAATTVSSNSQTSGNTNLMLRSNYTVYEGQIFSIIAIQRDSTIDYSAGRRGSRSDNSKITSIRIEDESNTKTSNVSVTEPSQNWISFSRSGYLIYGLPISPSTDFISKKRKVIVRISSGKFKIPSDFSFVIQVSQLPLSSHTVIMKMNLRQYRSQYLSIILLKFLVIRALHQYFNPSCDANFNSAPFFSYSSADSTYSRAYRLFCEQAADIVLYNVTLAKQDQALTVKWYRRSISPNQTVCDTQSIKQFQSQLFHISNSPALPSTINKQFQNHFHNKDLGRIQNIDLIIHEPCLNIKLPHVKTQSHPSSTKYRNNSNINSAKVGKIVGIIFGILILLLIIAAVAFYIHKNGMPCELPSMPDVSFKLNGGAKKRDDENGKEILMEEKENEQKQKKLKLTISEPTSKSATNSAMNSSAFPPNSSPKTPLLSAQFSREDSTLPTHNQKKSTTDSFIQLEAASGSYSAAAAATIGSSSPLPSNGVLSPQSPTNPISESGNATNETVASPGAASPTTAQLQQKQQQTTTMKIRNPAMMMGSRLNPYRNIPPPII